MTRSEEKEWMDLGCYSEKEYRQCLQQLDRIGRYLGGDRATLWAFDQLKKPPQSILDVGCGGGLFTRRLAERYPNAKVVGIDISKEAIEFASQYKCANLEFVVSDLNYPENSFDIVTSTLVCHHMTDAELVQFLKKAHLVSRQGIILNDLHRHSFAKLSYCLAAPFLFLNRMVMHDGLISIDRSFLREEWIGYFKKAGIPLNQVSIDWKWAFRWMIRVCHGK